MGKRVVRLTRVDQERLDRGEIECPEEALHIHDAPPVKSQKPRAETTTLSPREQDILREVPPHFGKL